MRYLSNVVRVYPALSAIDLTLAVAVRTACLNRRVAFFCMCAI